MFSIILSLPLFFLVSLGGVRLSALGTSATVGLLYQPRMIDDDYGAVGGMIGRGNQSTRRKPAPVPLCPPQIPRPVLGSNPGLRSGKPVTNGLSYGTAPLPLLDPDILLSILFLECLFAHWLTYQWAILSHKTPCSFPQLCITKPVPQSLHLMKLKT
jgi:hypothetical protein